MNGNIRTVLESQLRPTKEAIARRWLKRASDRILAMMVVADGAMRRDRYTHHRPHVDEPDRRDFNPHGNAGCRPYSSEDYARKSFEKDLLELFNARWLKEFRGDVEEFTPKTREELEVMAKDYADRTWIAYLDKMESKFEGIAFESASICGDDPIDNEILITAKNGISFHIKNTVVFKTSQHGVFFAQFPARFGNVCRDGQPLRNAASQQAVEDLTPAQL